MSYKYRCIAHRARTNRHIFRCGGGLALGHQHKGLKSTHFRAHMGSPRELILMQSFISSVVKAGVELGEARQFADNMDPSNW